MGVMSELGYDVKRANGFQRGVQRVAQTGPLSKVFQKTMYAIDRPIYRWSKGRITVPSVVAGLPIVMLTTTGAKSGEPREMPLLGIPHDDDIAIIGSNYGTQRTPGWVYNLEADPNATVGYGEREVEVVARRAHDDEYERIFEEAATWYSGYALYRERAAHREIRVFVLELAG